MARRSRDGWGAPQARSAKPKQCRASRRSGARFPLRGTRLRRAPSVPPLRVGPPSPTGKESGGRRPGEERDERSPPSAATDADRCVKRPASFRQREGNARAVSTSLIARPPRSCPPWSPSPSRPSPASTSRRRSLSAQFFAARAAVRSATSASTAATSISALERARAVGSPEKPISASAARRAPRLGVVERGDRGGRVEVVAQRRDDGRIRRGVGRARLAVPAMQVALGLLQRPARPVDRLAVVGLEHREARHLARPVRRGRPRSSRNSPATFDHSSLPPPGGKAVVHPHVGHARYAEDAAGSGRSRSRGGGEHEVDAAAVDVEDLTPRGRCTRACRRKARTRCLPRHGRALDVPAPAAPGPRSPRATASPARRGRRAFQSTKSISSRL